MRKKTMSVGAAIVVGLIWVNLPIFPLMFGVPMILVQAFGGLLDEPLEGINVVIGILTMTSGFVVAWLWWSINVPKWRLWAYERVADIPKLKAAAVSVGLVWPDGHFFARTEIKSKEHAERERALEQQPRDA